MAAAFFGQLYRSLETRPACLFLSSAAAAAAAAARQTASDTTKDPSAVQTAAWFLCQHRSRHGVTHIACCRVCWVCELFSCRHFKRVVSLLSPQLP